MAAAVEQQRVSHIEGVHKEDEHNILAAGHTGITRHMHVEAMREASPHTACSSAVHRRCCGRAGRQLTWQLTWRHSLEVVDGVLEDEGECKKHCRAGHAGCRQALVVSSWASAAFSGCMNWMAETSQSVKRGGHSHAEKASKNPWLKATCSSRAEASGAATGHEPSAAAGGPASGSRRGEQRWHERRRLTGTHAKDQEIEEHEHDMQHLTNEVVQLLRNRKGEQQRPGWHTQLRV